MTSTDNLMAKLQALETAEVALQDIDLVGGWPAEKLENIFCEIEELKKAFRDELVPAPVQHLMQNQFGIGWEAEGFSFKKLPLNKFVPPAGGVELVVLPLYPVAESDASIEFIGATNVKECFSTRLLEEGPRAKVYEKVDFSKLAVFVVVDHDSQEVNYFDW